MSKFKPGDIIKYGLSYSEDDHCYLIFMCTDGFGNSLLLNCHGEHISFTSCMSPKPFGAEEFIGLLDGYSSKLSSVAEAILYADTKVVNNITYLQKLVKYGYRGYRNHTESELADFQWRFHDEVGNI